jgi:hypothetical protein
MVAQQVATIFQDYCYQGHAQDTVEVLDSDGNVICVLDKISIVRDHDRNVAQIKVHHKNNSEF